MLIQKFTHSTASIPRASGTLWVKAKDANGNTIILFVQHSRNVYQTVFKANKESWNQKDITCLWLEVLLDSDNSQAA